MEIRTKIRVDSEDKESKGTDEKKGRKRGRQTEGEEKIELTRNEKRR